MIKWILKRGAIAMSKRYNYDTQYMQEITNVSTSAGIRLWMLSQYSGFVGPDPEVFTGAILASTLDGDCGPCAQLVIDMALASGVSAQTIRECIDTDGQSSSSVSLGFRFAQAAITDRPDVEHLREEIRTRSGGKAVIAASFAASAGRVYPVMKRGLGHGSVCQSLELGSQGNVEIRKTG